jgi:hypothetical protein
VDQKDLILEDYVAGILGCCSKSIARSRRTRRLGHQRLKEAIFTRFGVDILAEGLKPETLNRQELGDAIFRTAQNPL